ncbi:MAG: YraN family protein [Spirochaetota bacterium]|nr:YraN family protein [Spirochaetota bacterium]
MKNSTDNREVGRKGEDIACDFLKEKDFEIIKRNYRFQRAGEIDIIVKKDNLIVFVEVKNRKTSDYGGALYSISNRKKRTLRKIAYHFLSAHPQYHSKDFLYRFDLISIFNGKIEWIDDIIR